MRYLLILLIFASCTTSRKSSSSTTVVVDSTSIRAWQEHAAMLEKQVEEYQKDSSAAKEIEVIFADDCDCDSSKPAPVIVFDNGKIASITGQLKSIKQQLTDEVKESSKFEQEASFWKSKYDSVANNKKVDIKEEDKEVKRTVTPIWVWFLIALLSVALLREYFPRIIDFFKPKI